MFNHPSDGHAYHQVHGGHIFDDSLASATTQEEQGELAGRVQHTDDRRHETLHLA